MRKVAAARNEIAGRCGSASPLSRLTQRQVAQRPACGQGEGEEAAQQPEGVRKPLAVAVHILRSVTRGRQATAEGNDRAAWERRPS